MIPSDILIEVRDKNLRRWGQIRPQDLDVQLTKVDLGVGYWTVRLPSEHPMVPYLSEEGGGIIAYIRGKRFMSGSCISPSSKASPEDPGGIVTFQGVDDNDIIDGAVCFPDPAIGDPQAQTTESHDIRSGKAETVLKDYVRRNIGQNAHPSRRTGLRTFLRTATDMGRGPTIKRQERFSPMGEVGAEISILAGFGFDTIQVEDEIVFDIFERRDRTKFVRFDIRNGTLSEESVATSAPNVTRPIVLGQGQGTDRQVVARTTPQSVAAEAAWGRVREVVYDRRDSDDPAVLEQKAMEVLEADGFTATNVKAVPADETTMRYLDDWREGDRVAVIVRGQHTATTVSKVTIVANSTGVAIAAGFGDVSGFDSSAALNKRVEDTEKRLGQLERNLEVKVEEEVDLGVGIFSANSEAEQTALVNLHGATGQKPLVIMRRDAPGPPTLKITKDGVLWSYLQATRYPAPWIAVAAYSNGWAGYGSQDANYGNASYMKTGAGIVVLRGLIFGGTVGQVAFTLPVGYRPDTNMLIPVISNNGPGIIRVNVDGTVVPVIGASAWFSLSQVMFPAADPTRVWTPVGLANGFTVHGDPSFGVPGYWIDSMNRLWYRGLIMRAAGVPGSAVIAVTGLPHLGNNYVFGTNGSSTFSSVAAIGTTMNWMSGGSPAAFIAIHQGPYYPRDLWPDEKWTPAPYVSPWTSLTGWPVVGLATADDGLVGLRGMARAGTIGSVAARLPTGSRPGMPVSAFMQVAFDAIGRWNVHAAAGDLSPTVGNTGWNSLNGVNFIAEA